MTESFPIFTYSYDTHSDIIVNSIWRLFISPLKSVRPNTINPLGTSHVPPIPRLTFPSAGTCNVPPTMDDETKYATVPEPTPDRRSLSSATNGAAGGRPPGTENESKRYYPTSQLVDETVASILAGRKSPLTIRPGEPVTERDKHTIRRISGISAEEFSARLTARMQDLADACAERIAQKLGDDSFKPEGLSFLLTVLVDKIQRLEGKNQLSNSAVGTQINIFAGSASRADVLASLRPSLRATDVQASQVQ